MKIIKLIINIKYKNIIKNIDWIIKYKNKSMINNIKLIINKNYHNNKNKMEIKYFYVFVVLK